MYILLKTNETSPSHNVMLIKFKSICDCIDHDKRSKTRYPPPQIHPPPPPKKKAFSSLYANNTRTFKRTSSFPPSRCYRC